MTTSGRIPWRTGVAGALLLVFSGLAHGQSATPPERFFRVQWEPEAVPRHGWSVEGYIYNDHSYRVGGVRLRVEVLDAAGTVVASGFGWVHGDIPAGDRAYFLAPLPRRGASYRVSVVNFHNISGGAP
jgi:hypothetical protein